jgi:hypothetical protein
MKSLDALRAQQAHEIKHCAETFGYEALGKYAQAHPGLLTGGTIREHSTRHQAFARNFHAHFVGKTPPQVTTVPLADLVAMLDTPEADDGIRFAIVSKPCSKAAAQRHVTTVLDVNNGTLYRATHAGGMVSFWRGLAKRRQGVEFVPAHAAFSP